MSNEARPPALCQQQPLRRYAQLWSQLTIIDDVVSRQYRPGPTDVVVVTVPLIPASLWQSILQQVG